MNHAYMIMDLQYGSGGKGSLAGYLAMENNPDVVVTAWAPNAGHTYIDEHGKKYIHRMLANGVVSPGLEYILIAPGSVIDPKVLIDEVRECKQLLRGKMIVIHPHAAIVLPQHLEQERAFVKIGSTMKGSGAALIQKIERDPHNKNTAAAAFPNEILDGIRMMGIEIRISGSIYSKALDHAKIVQIEGAQGFSLSIHHGQYPYTTSRDVTPAQMRADCAIPYDWRVEVYGVLRTYPIRVANRFDESGKQIGTSGHCYPDQKELKWEDIGIEPELTTVTKLPRRIFSFSSMQLNQALRLCAPTKIFMNFANYMKYEPFMELINGIFVEHGIQVVWVGVGAEHKDVITSDNFMKPELRNRLESEHE